MLVILLSDDNELICLEVGTCDQMTDWLVIVLEVDLSAPTMCCDEKMACICCNRQWAFRK
jgi:hypothetical protein